MKMYGLCGFNDDNDMELLQINRLSYNSFDPQTYQ
jgi:hypothetical protein